MFASLIGKANRLARMMLKENEAKTAAKKKKTEISFIIGSRVADFVKVGETWLFAKENRKQTVEGDISIIKQKSTSECRINSDDATFCLTYKRRMWVEVQKDQRSTL